MENLPLISVVVPIYNVEKYLDRCISSIVNQTYKNLEIILVDDGSPDNCPQMCDEWANKDNRVKVLHIENGGAGNARNVGFEYSSGEWVAFIDSDDFIDLNMFYYLLSLCDNETDIAECCLINTFSDKADFVHGKMENDQLVECGAETALEYHIINKMFNQTPPNKIYRRRVVENVPFPTGKFIDDEFWTYQVIAKCRKLVHSSYVMYAYRQQSDSVTHSEYSLNWLQSLEAKKKRIKLIELNFPNLYNIACRDIWFSCIYHGQQSLKYLDKNDKRQAFNFLKRLLREYPFDIKSIKNEKKTHYIWFFMSKISFVLTCRLRNLLKVGL